MNAIDYDYLGELPDELDAIEVAPGHELCPGCLRQVTPDRWDPKECCCTQCVHFDRLEHATEARELEAARARREAQSVVSRAHKNQRRLRRGCGPSRGRS